MPLIEDVVRLGKAPKQMDPRTLQYKSLRAPGPWRPPASYSWDGENLGAVPCPMFANDRYGCCVISERAHHTLRFEFNEQGLAVPITDAEVVNEYLAESGGQDNGLVMLYSMRDWRTYGWKAGGRRYNIHSFLAVTPQDHDAVKEATVVGQGLAYGVSLPLSAADQLNAGGPWVLSGGPRSASGSWGGHAILASEYNADGVTFITWGKRQFASWDWIDAYCDECYLVIDNVDADLAADIRIDDLNTALAEIARDGA